jgi:hypothetical protein
LQSLQIKASKNQTASSIGEIGRNNCIRIWSQQWFIFASKVIKSNDAKRAKEVDFSSEKKKLSFCLFSIEF